MWYSQTDNCTVKKKQQQKTTTKTTTTVLYINYDNGFTHDISVNIFHKNGVNILWDSGGEWVIIRVMQATGKSVQMH